MKEINKKMPIPVIDCKIIKKVNNKIKTINKDNLMYLLKIKFEFLQSQMQSKAAKAIIIENLICEINKDISLMSDNFPFNQSGSPIMAQQIDAAKTAPI